MLSTTSCAYTNKRTNFYTHTVHKFALSDTHKPIDKVDDMLEAVSRDSLKVDRVLFGFGHDARKHDAEIVAGGRKKGLVYL